jgi:carbonic anhydrase
MAVGTDTSAMSPAQALARLMTDNQRFQNNTLWHLDLDPARREKLVGGQSPLAAILFCSDSRVPPELIFEQGRPV